MLYRMKVAGRIKGEEVNRLVDLLDSRAIIAGSASWATSAWEATGSTWHAAAGHTAGHATLRTVELHHL